MKQIISSVIILIAISCNKNESVTPSSSPTNIIGKWKITSNQNKKSGDYYQEEAINKQITLTPIETWDYIVLTNNKALLITFNEEVINFGNYILDDNQITLLDTQTNNTQILLLFNLTTSSQATITYTSQEIISEDDNETQPQHIRLTCYKI
jgi:hypothetical protein